MSRRSFVSVCAAAGLLAACASRGPAPERELFRLETASLADGAARGRPVLAPAQPASSQDAADDAAARVPGSSRRAYQTSIRLVRPDGIALMAPRLTSFAEQRANIQVMGQTAYVMDFDTAVEGSRFIADPVIAMIHEGTSIDLLVAPVRGTDAEVAVALRVVATAARRPFATRVVGIPATVAIPSVSIEIPRAELVEIVGGQRVQLGSETEWARVPDPAGRSDLLIMGRVDAVVVEESAEPVSPADVDAAPEPFRPPGARAAALLWRPLNELAPAEVNLRALAGVVAGGAETGVLRVAAIRLPAGVADPAAPTVVRLGELTLRTVAGHGARAANVLREACLTGWRFGDGGGPGDDEHILDPSMGTETSGIVAELSGSGGTVELRWTTVSAWGEHTNSFAGGPPVSIDLPDWSASVRTAVLVPGRTVHPMFRLPDGGTGAIVVEWTPDARGGAGR